MTTQQSRTPRSARPRRRSRRGGYGLYLGGAAFFLVLLAWYLFGSMVLWLAGLGLAAILLLATTRQSAAPKKRTRRPTAPAHSDYEAPPVAAPKSRAASMDLNTIGADYKPVMQRQEWAPAKRVQPVAATAAPEKKAVKLPVIPPPLYPNARPILAGREPVTAPPPAPVAEEMPLVVVAEPEPEPMVEEEEPPVQAGRPLLTVIHGGKKPEPEPEPEPEPDEEPAPVVPQPAQVLPMPLPKVIAAEPTDGSYQLPTPDMLPVPAAAVVVSDDEHIERAILLEHTLKTFGVEAKVVDISPGPVVTRYELQPAPGVRVNKFTQLSDDLALALAAEGIRIEAPIPGKSAVGIEVPNKERQMVPLREVLEMPQFRNHPSKLAVAFGKDNAGNPVIGDLARMPHMLIAGSTGSGKSVCMNTIICSLLFKARPDEVKMLMIDPKMVELSVYNGIPHLTAPVIIDVKKAAGYLKGAVKEMENRYALFAAMGVRNIQQYNQVVAADPGPDPEHPRQPLPYVVIFIDELADLMMVAPADVEDAICRLAQMARACGMHLVIATQSPRVDVITGLIKANVPSRIAFAVSSQIDSRVIMDAAGAERLLGRGDMLYHPSGLPKPVRAQGAFIDEHAVEGLVRYVKVQGKPVFTAQEVAVETDKKAKGGAPEEAAAPSAADAAFPMAVRVVIEHGQASVSILQRRLRCNYNKAVRLIDMMEERGFVGPHQGSKPRDVLISLAQWRDEFGATEDGSEELPVGEQE